MFLNINYFHRINNSKQKYAHTVGRMQTMATATVTREQLKCARERVQLNKIIIE